MWVQASDPPFIDSRVAVRELRFGNPDGLPLP